MYNTTCLRATDTKTDLLSCSWHIRNFHRSPMVCLFYSFQLQQPELLTLQWLAPYTRNRHFI